MSGVCQEDKPSADTHVAENESQTKSMKHVTELSDDSLYCFHLQPSDGNNTNLPPRSNISSSFFVFF